MTDTVTAHTTGADRRLLANISRWRKANGWTRNLRGFLVNPDRTLGVDISDGSDGMGTGFRLMRGDLLHKPTDYPADSIRQAVDLLAALGILPPHLSSQYAAGFDSARELTVDTAVGAVTAHFDVTEKDVADVKAWSTRRLQMQLNSIAKRAAGGTR
ncbi:hypothetical protein [Micromonospora sp. NPDC023633]|uniref:hypothetical protein n=1 Tax=Micromonospora sp. NPDC023633 TaxID=3154320 RepID=UPI0033D1A6F6